MGVRPARAVAAEAAMMTINPKAGAAIAAALDSLGPGRGRVAPARVRDALEPLGPALVGHPLRNRTWNLKGIGPYTFRRWDAAYRAMHIALFRAHEPQRVRVGRTWVKESDGTVAAGIVPVDRPDRMPWYVRKEFWAELRREWIHEERLRRYYDKEVPASDLGRGGYDCADLEHDRAVGRLFRLDAVGSKFVRDLRPDVARLVDALDPDRERPDAYALDPDDPLDPDQERPDRAPRFNAEARADKRDARALAAAASTLDPLPREALRLALEGHDNVTIVRRLGRDERTVRRYLADARTQLEARDLDLETLRRRRTTMDSNRYTLPEDGLRALLRTMTPEEVSDMEAGGIDRSQNRAGAESMARLAQLHGPAWVAKPTRKRRWQGPEGVRVVANEETAKIEARRDRAARLGTGTFTIRGVRFGARGQAAESWDEATCATAAEALDVLDGLRERRHKDPGVVFGILRTRALPLAMARATAANEPGGVDAASGLRAA